VFAILSHPSAIDPLTGEPLIDVDYSKSAEKVFAEATAAIIRSERNFKAWFSLTSDPSHDDMSYWPSWVPEWDEAPRAQILSTARSFHACGKYSLQQANMSTNGPECVLNTSGFLVDIIETCGKVSPVHIRAQELPSGFTSLREVWTRIAQRVQNFYGHQALNALGACLTACEQLQCSFDDDFESYFYHYWYRCWLQEPPLTELISESNKLEYKVSTAFWKAYISSTDKGTLFVTRRGFLGLGPDSLQNGDTVAVLCGGHVTYLLRQAPGYHDNRYESRHRLLGVCYVHSLMEGEIEELAAHGEVHMNPIQIC